MGTVTEQAEYLEQVVRKAEFYLYVIQQAHALLMARLQKCSAYGEKDRYQGRISPEYGERKAFATFPFDKYSHPIKATLYFVFSYAKLEITVNWLGVLSVVEENDLDVLKSPEIASGFFTPPNGQRLSSDAPEEFDFYASDSFLKGTFFLLKDLSVVPLRLH
ncbi:hypothetical protein M9H77_17157 [Catharanthus roseus]|uniref:Uncharacterized protein n=1 Tax=Catharanthus roseus TaxID=4058 RepID=A0ACC0B3T4_CATRO|nr:hypothetical protein M9H77_17157 [Catharanthus roseus]